MSHGGGIIQDQGNFLYHGRAFGWNIQGLKLGYGGSWKTTWRPKKVSVDIPVSWKTNQFVTSYLLILRWSSYTKYYFILFVDRLFFFPIIIIFVSP